MGLSLGQPLSYASTALALMQGGGDHPFPAPVGFRWQQVFFGTESVQSGTQNVYTLERTA